MLSWKKKIKDHIKKESQPSSLEAELNNTMENLSINNRSNTLTQKDANSSTFSSPSTKKTEVSSTISTSNEESKEIPKETPVSTSTTEDIFTTDAQPGCLNVKIYSGKNLKLPFDLVLNEFILTKIASCADDCDVKMLMKNIQDVVEKSKVGNESLLGATVTGCLPAIVSVPNTEGSKGSEKNGNADSNIDGTVNGEGDSSNNNTGNSNSSEGVRNPLIYITAEFDKNVSLVQPASGLISDPVFNNVSSFDAKGNGLLVVQVFVKIPNILIPQKFSSLINQKTPSQDILVGSFKMPLNLNYNVKTRLLDHEWISLSLPNDSSGVCAANGGAPSFSSPSVSETTNSSLNVTIEFKPNKNKPLTIDDFDLLKVIGKGSFGKVMQVRKKDTQRVYALKSIRKAHIVAKLEVTHTIAERNVLVEVNNPFIVSLKFCFQSPDKLYFVLDFINGGELFHHLQREGRFSLDRSRFYICELLSAIEHLHSLDIIYRDLKPENILLDYEGHIALCDFGLCKRDMKISDRTSTFCGTPEYLAPELLLGQGYTRVVDWWTLGVLLYEMLTGLPPFYDDNIPKMYKKILQDELKFPEVFDSDAKDLLIKLLDRDPKKRLGGKSGSEEIKKHQFFNNIDWKRLNNKGYTPLFKPPVSGAFDTDNFDSEFTNEVAWDSVVNDRLSRSMQKQFEGWTYVGESRFNTDD